MQLEFCPSHQGIRHPKAPPPHLNGSLCVWRLLHLRSEASNGILLSSHGHEIRLNDTKSPRQSRKRHRSSIVMTARWSDASQPTNFLSKGLTQPSDSTNLSPNREARVASQTSVSGSQRASATVADMPYFFSSSSAACKRCMTEASKHKALRDSRKRPPMERMARVPSRPSRAMRLKACNLSPLRPRPFAGL